MRHRDHPARRQEGGDLQSAAGNRRVAGAHDGRRRDRRSQSRVRRATRWRRGWSSTTSRSSPTIRTARGSKMYRSRSAAARSSASPASPATARTNCSRRSPARRLAPGAGAIVIDGQRRGPARCTGRRRMGAAFVPEERLGHGTAPRMKLSENALLTGHAASGMVKHGFIDKPATLAHVDRTTEKLRRAQGQTRSGSGQPVRRQPAEIHRRPRNPARARACSSSASRPGASMRARPRPSARRCIDLAGARRGGAGHQPGPRRARRNRRPHRGDVPRPAVAAARGRRSDPRTARLADGRRPAPTGNRARPRPSMQLVLEKRAERSARHRGGLAADRGRR